MKQFQAHYGKQSVPSAPAGGSTLTAQNAKGKKRTSSAKTPANDMTADLVPPADADGTDLTGDAKITKEDIFHYVYAVLHSPVYREKYEQNLKRKFPRIPFYEYFFQWRDWGAKLMDLHINYETQEPFALERKDLKPAKKQTKLIADKDKKAAEDAPATKLRALKTEETILIDSVTTLSGVPSEVWEYKLGNRSTVEWILDQYKEKTPSDTTIREKFNTYKFADYKEQVIDLIEKVTTVSVKTMEIINSMP